MSFLSNLVAMSLIMGVCVILACALVIPASWVYDKTDSALAATVTLLVSATIAGAGLMTLLGRFVS